jgi:hypothetical protein
MSTSHKSIETSAKVMLRELRDAQISPAHFLRILRRQQLIRPQRTQSV